MSSKAPGPVRPFRALLLAVTLLVLACASSVGPLDAGRGASTDVATLEPDGASHGPDGATVPPDGATTPDAHITPPGEPIRDLDLLLEIDNSNSMATNQSKLTEQIARFVSILTNPLDSNGDGVPDLPPFVSVHVGVISSDLGSGGASVRGCAESDVGDDGLLNPIRFGAAEQRHEPWTTTDGGGRPIDCTDAAQFPAFIAFESQSTDPAAFDHDVRCNAGLNSGGCGLEQQLEAIWRAIVLHHADDSPGNSDPNAGFIRSDALLAVVLLTDEEDGSVRDCRYAEPGVACTGATSVFDEHATGWAATNLNMRFYMYQPCSAEDPTWSLDRYIDPRNPSRGFLSVKPGHPERVLFAAITGVPIAIPRTGAGGVNWSALLGASGGDDNDFCGRDTQSALTGASAEGPVSMRQANRDPNPNCTDRTVPACRRQGTTYDPANPPCASTEQYFAWPARRVVEIARRFDEAPLCNGAPCHNGVLGSICASDYGAAMTELVGRIVARRQ